MVATRVARVAWVAYSGGGQKGKHHMTKAQTQAMAAAKLQMVVKQIHTQYQ